MALAKIPANIKGKLKHINAWDFQDENTKEQRRGISIKLLVETEEDVFLVETSVPCESKKELDDLERTLKDSMNDDLWIGVTIPMDNKLKPKFIGFLDGSDKI
jgi:predicted glycosyltransferase